MLVSNNGATPTANRPARIPAETPAPSPAIAIDTLVKATGTEEEKAPEAGFLAKLLTGTKDVGGWMVQKKKNIDKLGGFEKFVLAVVGFVVGWKLNNWVHNQMEKKAGNDFNKYGQDQYNSFKGAGSDKLVEALSEKHTFAGSVADLDLFKSQWRAFNTFTVMAETDRPTIGDFQGKANAPIALIALASNPTADKTAMTVLAEDIKRRGNGSPAKQDYYKDVINALAKTHNIVVTFDNAVL